MLRTLGIKARILALAAPVAVATVVGVVFVVLTADEPMATAVAVGGIGALGTVITLILGGVVSTSIARALAELSAAAEEVSASLPVVLERVQAGEDVEFDDLPVETNDELGRLTTSVNEMSKASVEFAKSQALVSQDNTDVKGQIAGMFVNVARRDQTLLKRLLSQLDQLERSEENPDTLDALFKLDHLATRMRRNAESLLVLAGRESSRRRRQPMPLTDVVRSASSEIEHYERVDLAQYVDPAMLGHSALPTAHLLAELLENATRYSDPGSRVSVETNEGPRGIRVTISDTGLGMSSEEIDKFNERIANPPSDEVIAAEKMGFYVVGRLAKKLEAVVTLAKGESKGTVAMVDLAPALFSPGSVKPVEDSADGDATWHSDTPASAPEPEVDEPQRTTVMPDLTAAADAFASLEAEEMISPEIVAPQPRPGGLPARSGSLPARGKAPAEPVADATPAPVAAPAPPVDAPGADAPVVDAPATAGESAVLDGAAAPEAATSVDASNDAPFAPSPQFGAPPAFTEPSRVPAPRTDSADSGSDTDGGAPSRGGFAGLTKRGASDNGQPTAPSALASRPSADSRSELASLSRPTPPAPAPAADAAPARPTPGGAGALDIVPTTGRGARGRRKQERGPAPMPSVAAIAAAAQAPDEGYVPAAFVPSGPIGGPAPEPVADESSLSDVLRARSAMASQALSELSQLSGGTPLVRRERGATDVGKFVAASQARTEAPAAPARPTRSAADVRSMLSGFQAGVNRGRVTDKPADSAQ